MHIGIYYLSIIIYLRQLNRDIVPWLTIFAPIRWAASLGAVDDCGCVCADRFLCHVDKDQFHWVAHRSDPQRILFCSVVG